MNDKHLLLGGGAVAAALGVGGLIYGAAARSRAAKKFEDALQAIRKDKRYKATASIIKQLQKNMGVDTDVHMLSPKQSISLGLKDNAMFIQPDNTYYWDELDDVVASLPKKLQDRFYRQGGIFIGDGMKHAETVAHELGHAKSLQRGEAPDIDTDMTIGLGSWGLGLAALIAGVGISAATENPIPGAVGITAAFGLPMLGSYLIDKRRDDEEFRASQYAREGLESLKRKENEHLVRTEREMLEDALNTYKADTRATAATSAGGLALAGGLAALAAGAAS